MSLPTLRLLVDFGLMVLIWIVQLIIYPSFLYYSRKDLVTWHKKYTVLIGCIVGPLMFIQLTIALYGIFNSATLYSIGHLVMVGAVWLVTFIQFVPLHNAISDHDISKRTLSSLVDKNWTRTILWTLTFGWGVVHTVL